jgi:hypothetical protein
MNEDELQEALERVIDYQKWRRGDDNIIIPVPKKLGQDIDMVIKAAEAYAYLPAKIEGMKLNIDKCLYKKGHDWGLQKVIDLLKETKND